MQISMFSSEEPHASPTASPDSEKDWTILVVNSPFPMLQLLANIGPTGWSGRMSPESFLATEEPLLRAFWDCSLDGASPSHQTGGEMRVLSQASTSLTALHGE